MSHLFFIAKNNLKKKKSDVAVLICLIALAVLFLYISISVIKRTTTVLDDAYEVCNTADFVFVAESGEEQQIKELFEKQKEVEELEMSPCFYLTTKYRGERDAEDDDFNFLIGVIDEERRIGRIGEAASGEKKKNAIILPYYFEVSNIYQLGDLFYITLGKHTYEFEVAGFMQDPLFSSPLNVGTYRCFIMQSYMDEIIEKEGNFEGSGYKEYGIKLKPGESPRLFDERISAVLMNQISDLAGSITLSLNWELMRAGAPLLTNIGISLLLVFVSLLIFIAIIIVRFSIKKFVEENMRNIGILQASGYTAKQLKRVSLLEVGLISACGSVAGVALGHACGGGVGKLQAALIGVQWVRKFDASAAAISIISIIIINLLNTLHMNRIYRKITVLDALRGGMRSHNFRKNYVRLEETNVSLPSALGIKNILSEKRKNFGVLCIVALLSLSCCIGFSLYQNFALNQDNLLKMSGMEVGTVMATGENLIEKGKSIEKMSLIEKVNCHSFCSTRLINGKNQITISCDFWDHPENVENIMLVEGRLPEYENEIAITTNVSKQLEAKEGDVIYAESTGSSTDYIIVGITQQINNMGFRAIMNFKGAERLNGTMESTSLYIYGKDNADYEAVSSQIKQHDLGLSLTDSEKMKERMLSSVVAVMKMICVLFVVLTLCVVFLVVYLLIKSKVIREGKEYGIYKALGFTTKQLVIKTIMTNLPVMVAGAVIGAVLSIFVTDSLIVAALRVSFGFRECEMVIHPIWLIVTVLGISFTALGVAIVCALNIREIEPVKMLAGE